MAADDIVCVTLNNGEKLPLLGYSLPTQNSDVMTDPLEKALQVGYRHIVVDFAGDLDLQIGHVLQRLFEKGDLRREDLFITIKMNVTEIERSKIKSRFLQRLYTLGCEYVDLVLLDIPKTKPTNGNGIIRPATNMQEKERDAVNRVWQGALSIKEEGYTRSLGLFCNDHVTLLNVLQRQGINPQVIMTDSTSCLVTKYGRNLTKFCEGRNIQAVVEIRENMTNGHSHAESRREKALNEIAYEMERGLDQVIARSYVERGLAVTPHTLNPTIIQQSFEVFDFSLHSQDLKTLISCDS